MKMIGEKAQHAKAKEGRSAGGGGMEGARQGQTEAEREKQLKSGKEVGEEDGKVKEGTREGERGKRERREGEGEEKGEASTNAACGLKLSAHPRPPEHARTPRNQTQEQTQPQYNSDQEFRCFEVGFRGVAKWGHLGEESAEGSGPPLLATLAPTSSSLRASRHGPPASSRVRECAVCARGSVCSTRDEHVTST